MNLDLLLHEDITVYYPLKCYGDDNKPKYCCTPYSFVGSLMSYSDAEDIIDFIKKCYINEKDCEDFCNKINEYERESNI